MRKAIITTQITGSVMQVPKNPIRGISHPAETIFSANSMQLEITGAVFCPMACMELRRQSRTARAGRQEKWN